MARRSARLSSRSSSTPQPMKSARLSHYDTENGPRTVPAKLTALRELDEIPGSFPQSPTEIISDTPTKRTRDGTPKKTSIIIPPREEMHPQAHHRTSLEKHDDARWLGFSNVEKAEATKIVPTIPRLQRTPSKANGPVNADAPTFQFTFQREQSLDLSPVAKKLMEENRQEAMRVKEQMKSDACTTLTPGPSQRPIATPKSGRGRFSDVHKEQFQKMNSIAGHASAYRKDPARSNQTTSLLPSAVQGLKRSPAKAELDASEAAPSKTPRAVVADSSSADEESSPRKRARFNDPAPSPSPRKLISKQKSPSRLPALRTPTKSSIRHIQSDNSCKIPAPASAISTNATSTLLSKSPARAQIFGSQASATPSNLLSRTPIKPSTVKVPVSQPKQEQTPSSLSRSAAKSSIPEPASPAKVFTPLLAQTPTKAASAIFGAPQTAGSLENRFSMLRATPIKSILRTPQRLYSDDPAKVAAGTHLATPPNIPGRPIFRRIPATAPVRKHVDFSSSTKAREASKKQGIDKIFTAGPVQTVPASGAQSALTPITYPDLNATAAAGSRSTPRRRQSSGPSDFTFRAGHEIVFASSADHAKPCGMSQSPAGYTIRAVVDGGHDAAAKSSKKRKLAFEDAQSAANVQESPTVSLGSKKRKYDFENEVIEQDAMHLSTDKENTPVKLDERPLKRMKTAPKSPAAAIVHRAVSVPVQAEAPVRARTTLGVKPKTQVGKHSVKKLDAKKKKAGTTISMARLNALAQPKKRD